MTIIKIYIFSLGSCKPHNNSECPGNHITPWKPPWKPTVKYHLCVISNVT